MPINRKENSLCICAETLEALDVWCRVSIVAEQFVRMLHHVGMPKTDLDYIQGNGRVVGEILKKGHPRSTLFTGSQKVAEQLALDLKGKVGWPSQTCPCCRG